jgi:flagellar biogenesis protein FliO
MIALRRANIWSRKNYRHLLWQLQHKRNSVALFFSFFFLLLLLLLLLWLFSRRISWPAKD